MTETSNRIDTVKNFIEVQLDFLNISYETFLEKDDELGGYCYFICSDHAAVLFSDHTEDESLKMFRLDSAMLNWATEEGLSAEQRETMNAYIPVERVCDLLDYLSNNKFTESS